MNNIANSTTLWHLLSQTNVIIPILQRDYAQGRQGYENLRKKFLSSLKIALDEGQQLKLDFVYGSKEIRNRYNPLDGQQRLTTLWLLHWYLAYKLGLLGDDKVAQKMLNFSYETRSSSTQFTKQIVRKWESLKQNDGENISDCIMRQTWMPSFWRQDPTIQSMLRMLSGEKNEKVDGIEKLFANKQNCDLEKYWEELTGSATNCPIVFYILDLDNLGQSDDLYVKINGRGKPLSDYENFKADLLKYISDNDWTELNSPVKGLPVLLDTEWTDFFWQYIDKSISLDDIMFNFINRYFLVQMLTEFPEQKIEINDLKNTNGPLDVTFKYLYSFTEGKENQMIYNLCGFGVYQTLFDSEKNGEKLGKQLLEDLRTILESMKLFSRKELTNCVCNVYDKKETFELIYTSGNECDYNKQDIPETIVFWAVCQFFLSEIGRCNICKQCTIKKQNLRRWMRVVWNVCDYKVIENNTIRPEIRSRTIMRSTILALKKTFNDVSDIYSDKGLKNPSNDSNVNRHINEEIEKIRQISQGLYKGSVSKLIGKSWEEIIIEEEKRPIFKGSIRALFCNKDSNFVWSDFDTKYTNLHWYLDNYKDLNNIAYRNYLLKDFETIKDTRWFQKGENRNALWRSLLTYRYPATHDWLMSEPMDENQLSSIQLTNPTYCRRSIINTSLLSDICSDKGMYLTHSGTYNYDVFMHHQTSSPYVMFNETRDDLINEALNKGFITLVNSDNKKGKCGLFDTKDIVFSFNRELFNWHANSVLYMQSNDEIQIKQPQNLAAFITDLLVLRWFNSCRNSIIKIK